MISHIHPSPTHKNFDVHVPLKTKPFQPNFRLPSSWRADSQLRYESNGLFLDCDAINSGNAATAREINSNQTAKGLTSTVVKLTSPTGSAASARRSVVMHCLRHHVTCLIVWLTGNDGIRHDSVKALRCAAETYTFNASIGELASTRQPTILHTQTAQIERTKLN